MNNLNEFVQLFENPAVSSFNRSKRVDTDIRIGQFVPTYWDILGFGDSAKGESGHRMRLAPLVAPTFTDLRVQEHTAVVPIRVIMKDYETVFNYAKNKMNGASLPSINLYRLARTYRAMGKAGINIIGSLFDFFGYPVFSDAWKSFIRAINNNDNYYTSDDYFMPISYVESNYGDLVDSYSEYHYFAVDFRSTTYYLNDVEPVRTFMSFLAYSSGYDNISSLYDQLNKTEDINIDDLLPHTVFSTSAAAMNAYLNYLFSILITAISTSIEDPDSPQNYTTLPLRAYQRVYYDFLVNGNSDKHSLQLRM